MTDYKISVVDSTYANLICYTFNRMMKKNQKGFWYTYMMESLIDLCKATCVSGYEAKAGETATNVNYVFEFDDESTLTIFDKDQIDAPAVICVGKHSLHDKVEQLYEDLSCSYADALYHMLTHLPVKNGKNTKFHQKALIIFINYVNYCSVISHIFNQFDDDGMDNSTQTYEFFDYSALSFADTLQVDGICRVNICDKIGSEDENINDTTYAKLIETYKESEFPIQ